MILPRKDQPILSGAIQANASHLITGDRERFGRLFGRKVLGVTVLSPGEFLRREHGRHSSDDTARARMLKSEELPD